MQVAMKKVVAFVMIAILLVGAYVLLAPSTAEARLPGPPLPCDHCEPWFKTTHCFCHLIDCTPEDCAYTCTCW